MLVVAEKGSVARSIKAAIRPPPRALALSGHFLGLNFSEEYRIWTKVNPNRLFQAPIRWVVNDKKRYWNLIKALKEEEATLVIATDNDPEGELIAYEVLNLAENILGDFSYKRMRFNSTTYSELRQGWLNLEDELNWGWVWKALFRHKFDLITGAAYTRLLTLSAQKTRKDIKLVSWGSCQTPTLWFVFQRDMTIKNFKPEKYYVVEAILNVEGVRVKVTSNVIKEKHEASGLYEKANKAPFAVVEEFNLAEEVQLRPLPTDTDIMLQELTKLLPVSGVRIMRVAESLYADGYISYPRTQTNMWIKIDHKSILNMMVKTHLSNYVRTGAFRPRNGKKNDGAHPPIHPTKPHLAEGLKGKIWDYLARRYLANVVAEDAIFKRWSLRVDLNGAILNGTNRYLVQAGFYQVLPFFKPSKLQEIPEVVPGTKLQVEKIDLMEKETLPPPHLLESNLLRMMERYHIGTDATRQLYPTLIVKRGYAVRRGKYFEVSDFGEELINLLKNVDARLVTPETRAHVEEVMGEVERKEKTVDDALQESLKTYKQLYLKLQSELSFENGFSV